MPNNTAVSCAKMAEPIHLLFGLWTRGLKEAQVQSYLPVHGFCKHDFCCLRKIFTSFCKSLLMMRFSAFHSSTLFSLCVFIGFEICKRCKEQLWSVGSCCCAMFRALVECEIASWIQSIMSVHAKSEVNWFKCMGVLGSQN